MEIRLAEAQMLVVREDDGPDEIRQKADLMEDMAAQTRVKADVVVRRIKRLEEERRLRIRMATLRGELDFFDEAVLEGRSLSPGQAVEGTGGVLLNEASPAPENALPDAMAAGVTDERSGSGDATEIVEARFYDRASLCGRARDWRAVRTDSARGAFLR